MEAEILLSGNWKNIEEIEECLNLDELNALFLAGREKERRLMRFYGLFKGVDIDEDNSNDRVEEIKKRAEAKLSGKTEDQIDFEGFGIDIE